MLGLTGLFWQPVVVCYSSILYLCLLIGQIKMLAFTVHGGSSHLLSTAFVLCISVCLCVCDCEWVFASACCSFEQS